MSEKSAPSSPTPKRKRVTLACDSCRVRKTKCDSRRPICSRCEGYGFQCTWGTGRGRRSSLAYYDSHIAPRSLRESYELIQTVCSTLPEGVQPVADEFLTHLQVIVSQQETLEPAGKGAGSVPSSIGQPHSSRYLGVASDIHFYKVAAETFTSPDVPSEQNEGMLGNYDEEEVSHSLQPFNSWLPTEAEWSAGEKFLESYFCNIHVAYPFLPKSIIIRKYQDRILDTEDNDFSPAWYSLLQGVVAIGAYYDGFKTRKSARCSSKDAHAFYFRRSTLRTNFNRLEASTVQVSALLVQCFYLLLTSNTDRCWITLGIAIRLAQALGLHVDFVDAKVNPWGLFVTLAHRIEIRRRTWYSLYVLDRLVSLQLGRPPAISDAGLRVPTPSNLDDTEYDWNSQNPLPLPTQVPSSGDYFQHMVGLSTIIGHILEELSEPQQSIGTRLSRIQALDEKLCHWKQSLPRHLRFDLVHVFEKSRSFKKQRNMLATKYHHLRALMHRPFLDLPSPGKLTAESLSDDQRRMIAHHGRLCIEEARRTASLFHNVQDEVQLAQDYPLWQLVSCVVCAASILIVGEALEYQDPSATENTLYGDEAESCLQVLEALSKNSTGALQAHMMLSKLLTQREVFKRRMRCVEPGVAQNPHEQIPPLGTDAAQIEPISIDRDTAYRRDLMPLQIFDDRAHRDHGSGVPWCYDPFETIAWSNHMLNSMTGLVNLDDTDILSQPHETEM